MKRAICVACFLLIGAAGIVIAQKNPLSGAWQGEAHYPDGGAMRMVLLIVEQGATLTAKIHISNQGPQNLIVDPISRSGQTLNFEIKKLKAKFTGTIVGEKINGTLTENGTNVPLTLTRTSRPAEH